MSEEQKVPTFTDPEWSDYVLSHLTEDEKYDGHPKTDGVRRLVEKFIGPITNVDTRVVQCPATDNHNRAVVNCSVTLNPGAMTANGDYWTYCGSADADLRNTDAPFNQFPTAIAETRAFGRALRQALRIKTAVAEELSENAVAIAEQEDEQIKISDAQIKVLGTMCKKLDINLEKFVNGGVLKYDTIRAVSRNKARVMMKTLNEYSNASRKEIPEQFKGFDKNWETSFNL